MGVAAARSDLSGEKRLMELSFYHGRRVLVTGGASFIGSHLCELLCEMGAQVSVADNLSSGRLQNLTSVREAITFRQVDLRDPACAGSICRGQEVVFHLAACHGGRGYIDSHPVDCVSNMLLDHQLFSAACQAGAKTIVYGSSACVYPTNLQACETERVWLREADANFDMPGGAFADGEYGWAKLMGELQLRAFHKQFGANGVAVRMFTTYGERENESHALIALIAKAVLRLDPFPVWGSGGQTRNFTYVGDTVVGLALAGAKLTGFQIVNNGSSRHHTILEACEEIFAALGWRPKKIERQLDKPVGVRSRASDNSCCREVLGWEPRISLREGVRRTTRWYVESMKAKSLPELKRALVERD